MPLDNSSDNLLQLHKGFFDLSAKELSAVRVHQIAARLRSAPGEEGDFATVLRGAGLVLIIRVLASAVGYRQRDPVGALDGIFRIRPLQLRNRLDDSARISRDFGTARSRGTLRCAICGCQRLAARGWFHEGEFMARLRLWCTGRNFGDWGRADLQDLSRSGVMSRQRSLRLLAFQSSL